MKILRLFIVFFTIALSALIIACSCSNIGRQGEKPLRVAMLVDVGGLQGDPFNESAHRGLVRAMSELDCDIRAIESKSETEYEENLRKLAGQKFDLVIAVGVSFSEPLEKVAKEFPDVKFASIDGNLPDLPNVAVYHFREEEGSYLVGAMAGMVTHKKKLGFIGGLKIPLIEKFEAGYKAGAQTVSPDIEVLVDYVESFRDPDKAMNLANKQFDAGADIIFHAAGKSGNGVILAAHDRGIDQIPGSSGLFPSPVMIGRSRDRGGFFAIGVDSDQDAMAPGRVLVSMIKGVDTAVFDSIKAVKENQFKSGVKSLGVKEGAISLSEMKYTKEFVRALNSQILPKVNNLSSMIKEGRIQVPDTLEKLKDFKPPTNF